VNLRRRAFLKQAALYLAALGASQTGIAMAARRYGQALAKPTTRRLALLIGINQYPENVCDYDVSHRSALAGCVTDVQLQRLLLEHRFGFQPSDILTLTDQQATRNEIENAFQSHLIDQARPGDLVLFHFSGLGSKVKLFGKESVVRNSLVPVDGVLPTEDRPIINDLMEETLGLMLRSLATEQIVTILDLSHAKPQDSLRGSLKIRSRPSVPSGYISDGEGEFQKSLLQQIRGTREQAWQQWRSGQVPGLILKATKEPQIAAEGQWSGFSSGLFTYALTQHLWWMTNTVPLNISISLAGGQVEQVAGSQQRPVFGGQKSTPQLLANHKFRPLSDANADGVILAADSNSSTMQVSLVGLPAAVLENYAVNSLLQLAPPPSGRSLSSEPLPSTLAIAKDSTDSQEAPQSGAESSSSSATTDRSDNKTSAADIGTADRDLSETQGSVTAPSSTQAEPSATGGELNSSQSAPASVEEKAMQAADATVILQVRSRNGLRCKAKVYNRSSSDPNPQVGQYVQEYVRLLSKNISLIVALDAQLERIERVDATSALSSIPRISSVISGEQPADFLFGRAQFDTPTALSMNPLGRSTATAQSEDNEGSTQNGYGLFYLSRSAIPNTLSESEEAVKTAVNRIAPQLRTLLAAKLLRLTDNQGSSQLGVRATLEMLAPQERILMQQTTVRAPWPAPESRLASLFSPEGRVPAIPIGSHIQYRLQNYSDRPVYCALLGLDSGGNAIAIYPAVVGEGRNEGQSSFRESIIMPGDSLTVPQSTISAEWVVGGPVGLAETYIVCSRKPLKRTAIALSKAMRPMGSLRQLSSLTDPAKIVQEVLADLNEASLSELPQEIDISSDVYALNAHSWATLSFIYRVIE